jgi:predicted dehydrogenase
MERMNELEVFLDDGGRARGFRRVLVTEVSHPFMALWWPPGHIVGWGDTFLHEVQHLLGAIAGGHDVRPHGADFEDGYRTAEICDAIGRASETGTRQAVSYRS